MYDAKAVKNAMAKYKAKDVMRVTNLSRSTLDTWLFKGIITPTKPSVKRGRPSKYSSWDVTTIVIIDKLANAGLSLKKAAFMAEMTESVYFTDSEFNLVLHVNLENDSFILLPEDEPTPEDWELIVVIKPEKIAKKVKEKLQERT